MLDRLQAAGGEPWRSPVLAAELRRVGLTAPVNMPVRRIGGPAPLRTQVCLMAAKPHPDLFLHAPRHRFRNNKADLLQWLTSLGLPVLRVLDCRPVWTSAETIRLTDQPMLLARQQAVWADERLSWRGLGQQRITDALRPRKLWPTCPPQSSRRCGTWPPGAGPNRRCHPAR